MGNGAKDTVIKGYIRLPKAIRKRTDPIIQNRGKYKKKFEVRAEKGKQIVKDRIKHLSKRRRRRR